MVVTSAPLSIHSKTFLDSKKLTQAVDKYWLAIQSENQKVNLVSRETSREDFLRMCAESLIPLEQLDVKQTEYLDIGSGGGLPAIPILLTNSKLNATLVERTQKKALALERLLAQLKLEARILSGTVEEVKPDSKYGLITLRYVKLTERLLGVIERLLAPHGYFIYYSEPSIDPRGFNVRTYTYKIDDQPVHKHFSVFTK